MKERYLETTVCRLCLEPVTNFICIDCLLDNIQKWIGMHSSSPVRLREAVEAKHASVKKMLGQESNSYFCVSCRGQVDEIACPCCYLYEMQAAVKDTEPGIAQRFERDFNFDLIFHHGMAQLSLWESIHGRLLSSRSFKPVIITDKKSGNDMSPCESCEVESEDLMEVGGQWLCESCRDEVSFEV